MTVPATRDALFLRMAELLSVAELWEFDLVAEPELHAMRAGWMQIKDEVAAEVAATKEEAAP